MRELRKEKWGQLGIRKERALRIREESRMSLEQRVGDC